jgi:hypothetical protein
MTGQQWQRHQAIPLFLSGKRKGKVGISLVKGLEEGLVGKPVFYGIAHQVRHIV